ncbi:MAG: hypothetical protein ACXVZV_10255 [Terriglobales bacterium]
MGSPRWFSRLMIAVVAFALCGGPELLQAQQTTQPATTQEQQDNTAPAPATSDQSSPEPTSQDQNVGTTQQNATPDPSKGPLQPAETSTLPNAPSSPQPAQQQNQQQQPAQAPAGAAAAQGIKTAGGAASRPAGTAIAPAKQHQTRSLLIKIGAIAAGAAALGTVYALSRGSSSVPPGAR